MKPDIKALIELYGDVKPTNRTVIPLVKGMDFIEPPLNRKRHPNCPLTIAQELDLVSRNEPDADLMDEFGLNRYSIYNLRATYRAKKLI